ncbi:tetratricopeptide repeat protein [Bacteroides thetaiotaomicron]|nr:tetratricopeptide repeat protein [Bacteroides thetaiotaomicron]MCE9074713.1 tetratricopeptide repeat protein [Bacteroides thetaiotaomicron]MCS2600873.1 tetratricopeptide repeat protein [Bacteroides thetaiotaomicron]UYU63926.1 tetratricopeptide repeat protein [Bacteroides thetaiotaomicron]
MKLHISYTVGLFLIFSLSACHGGGNETTLLHQADSLMQEFPDSALYLLESIPHPEKLSSSERADYAIFLTRARTKLYVHESSDSLIRFAVDYYKRSWNNERKMQAYYYRGCVYRDMRCMDLAVKDFLQALKVIPKESEYLYLGAIYENLAGCYEEQDLYEDAMRAHYKAHEIYSKQKKNDGLFYAVRGIGYVFMLQHQLDSSLVYYQKVLDIAEAMTDDYYKSLILGELGILYSEKGEFQKANQYISASISSAPVGTSLFTEHLWKGRILRNLHQIDSARYYLNLSKSSSYIFNRGGSYGELYKLEKEEKNYPAAIAAADSFIYYLDSIYDTTKAAETTRLADQYEIELYQQKLAERYKIEVLSILLFFIIVGAVYLWIDKRRKKKYLELQNQLMKNRTDILSGDLEEQDNTESDFMGMLEPSLELCLQLFRRTETYEKLLSLEKKMGVATSLSIHEGQMICESIYETFGDIMLKLKIQYADLTKEDLLHCVFFLLGCSKETILLCTRASEGAFKSRKSRMKIKLGEEFFEWMTTCQYLVS